MVKRRCFFFFIILFLAIDNVGFAQAKQTIQPTYIILMIGDGFGANQIAATNFFLGHAPGYQSWPRYWLSTYPEGGSYDSQQAWSNINYPITSTTTDSAAAATALYTGWKTTNGRICVSGDGSRRLFSLAEEARQQGLAIGAVTSAFISDATPGAWLAHNDARGNYFAIGDESLWGNPDTTGITSTLHYGGGHGTTLPPPEVVVGAGHPDWSGNTYLNQAQRDKLYTESGTAGAFTFVERISGSPDGGSRLLASAAVTTTTRLMGLFGGSGGILEYRLASNANANPEEPTLAQMTEAALTVLGRNPQGFVLMVEGGAIDKAAHANNMDQMVGEALGFYDAVQAVIDWVDDPDNQATWQNTQVIVTADHETGYLTASPDAFADQPLGEVDASTLAKEKKPGNYPYRVSWEDSDHDNSLDSGEEVYWAWNSAGHSNSLVPLFVKGLKALEFSAYNRGTDPARGVYLDNTDVYQVMRRALNGYTLFLPTLYSNFVMTK